MVVFVINLLCLCFGVEIQFGVIGVFDIVYDSIVILGDVMCCLIFEGLWKVFFLGFECDLLFFDGFDVECVGEIEVEVIVCMGFFDDEMEMLEDYCDMLIVWQCCNVFFICVNFDLIVECGEWLIFCVGVMVVFYVEFGGEICIVGKLYCLIYEVVLVEVKMLCGDFDKVCVFVIGDGMLIDVCGVFLVGFDFFYISDGIYVGEYVYVGCIDEVVMYGYFECEQVLLIWWMLRLV